jgi:hypothetical protein
MPRASSYFSSKKNEIKNGRRVTARRPNLMNFWAAHLFFRQLPWPRFGYAGFPIGPPSEGLCPCCITSLVLLVILAFKILCNAGLSTISFSRSNCANSWSASLQEDNKRRTFWCASVKTRLISSSTMRAVSSLYSLEEGPPDPSANYLLADYDVCNQSLPCERLELAVSDRFDARRGEKAL